MRRYVAEVIGTFALIFAGTGAVVVNDVSHQAITHVGVALTWGMIVMALIYALGDVSGAHLNPAVTIGFWTARQFPGNQVAPYIVAQLIGAIAASVTLRLLFFDHGTLGATIPAGPWWQSFVLEVILTFLLMFIVLNVATGAKEKGIMAGAAIGATVGLEAMFAGPICGASMNPARSIAPALVSGHLEQLWIYIVATTAGAILAVFAYQFIQADTNSEADAASENHTVEEGS